MLVQVSNRFVMESKDGYRVDFWLAKTEHDKMSLKRRRRVRIYRKNMWIVTPEDLILQKLRAQRVRDIGDVVAILIRQNDKLNMEYLLHWAAMLDVLATLKQLIKKTGIEGG